MPLKGGKSKKVIAQNIKELKKAGKTPSQARAIALKTAGVPKSKKKKK